MIKENQRFLNKMQVFSDAVVVIISMILAYVIRFYIFRSASSNFTLEYYIQAAVIMLPLYLFLYSINSLYIPYRGKSYAYEFINISKSNILGLIITITFFFIIKQIDISRWTLVIFCISNTLLLTLKRFTLRKALIIFRKKGYNIKYVIIVGSGELSKNYLDKIRSNRSLGLVDIGYISDNQHLDGCKYLGCYSEMPHIIEYLRPDEVVAALEYSEYEEMSEVIDACEKSGTKISIVPFYTKYIPARPYIDEIDGLPLINIRRIPLDNIGNLIIKRTMDIILSVIFIIISSPIMLVTAIAIKFDSRGPIIFKQERIGLNKRPFTMYKFRSMRENSSCDSAWSINNDMRRTKLGSFIRKFSIDELPQFFNVLKGDMSIVGPRPEIPHYVNEFRESIPRYMVKHQVRPGITGWAQINGFRGDTSIKDRIEYDLYYIENWTWIFDIKIIFTTVIKGFVNREKLILNK